MSPQSEPRAWEHVLNHLEQMLVSGELSPGQRLPGERVLAAELGVGRSSVREALRVMEAMGLLKSQTGSGPTSGAMIVSRPTGGMAMLMRMQVAAQSFPVSDVVQTRLVLETEVMQLLATRNPTPDLGNAEELLDAMDDTELAANEFLVLDSQFHIAMADAAGNQVIAAMMAGLRESIEATFSPGRHSRSGRRRAGGCGTNTVGWSRRCVPVILISHGVGSSPISAGTTPKRSALRAGRTAW